MAALRKILAELIGLFVDDAGLAVGVVVWLCLARLLAVSLHPAGVAAAIVFVAGLLAILLASAVHGARRLAGRADPRL